MVANAWAEHEVDHRYNVRGYILDANQKAVSDLNVQIFSDSELLGSITTDSSGFYSLHLHLHNADRGKTLLLRAGPNDAELRVNFDSSDKTTVRVHHANFVNGIFSEEPLSRFRIPAWAYPVGGLLLLGVIAIALETRRKKKIRQKMKHAHSSQAPSKHKAKKGKRKRR